MEKPSSFPGELSISEFDYDLPKEKIAYYPLENRDQSKLLVYKDGKVVDSQYRSISDFLKPGSLMVFNESKVVYARLQFARPTGSIIEIFCLEPSSNAQEINIAMQSTRIVEWKCMVGDLKKWKEKHLSMEIELSGDRITLRAEIVSKEGGSCLIRFEWDSDKITFAELLLNAGKVPLPPYIKRSAEDSDKQRYQTIYAKHEGSVAAPTAGLHFTPFVFDSLKQKGIDINFVTLHVGAGTFKPVKTETIGEHEMHGEQIVVSLSLLKELLSNIENDLIAVGTTSLRTLESLYWIGLKLYLNQYKGDEIVSVDQWEPYQLEAVLSPKQSIEQVIHYLETKKAEVLIAKTGIIIVPGYPWKLVNILATNFHQPKSTLMLLVASFIGQSWKEVYNHALENDYRFLSYGDGSLLFRG